MARAGEETALGIGSGQLQRRGCEATRVVCGVEGTKSLESGRQPGIESAQSRGAAPWHIASRGKPGANQAHDRSPLSTRSDGATLRGMQSSNAAIESRARSHADENEIIVASAAQVSVVFIVVSLAVASVCACTVTESKRVAKIHLLDESEDRSGIPLGSACLGLHTVQKLTQLFLITALPHGTQVSAMDIPQSAQNAIKPSRLIWRLTKRFQPLIFEVPC
jgi:hypothetical protein